MRILLIDPSLQNYKHKLTPSELSINAINFVDSDANAAGRHPLSAGLSPEILLRPPLRVIDEPVVVAVDDGLSGVRLK